MKKPPTPLSLAKQIILDLLDAGHDDAITPLMRDGMDVDYIFSRIKGRENKGMTMRESERRTDAAIKRAWRALTGRKLPKGADPVEFINEKTT